MIFILVATAGRSRCYQRADLTQDGGVTLVLCVALIEQDVKCLLKDACLWKLNLNGRMVD